MEYDRIDLTHYLRCNYNLAFNPKVVEVLLWQDDNGVYYKSVIQEFCNVLGTQEHVTEKNLVGSLPLCSTEKTLQFNAVLFATAAAYLYSENILISLPEQTALPSNKELEGTTDELLDAYAADAIEGGQETFTDDSDASEDDVDNTWADNTVPKVGDEKEEAAVPKKINATLEEMHKEAVNTMRCFANLNPRLVKDFAAKGIVYMSDDSGRLYFLDEHEKGMVATLEKQLNCMVYHVLHYGTEKGEWYTMLYIGADKSDWAAAREDLFYSNVCRCYGCNVTHPAQSEIGYIVVEPINGALRPASEIISEEEDAD